MKKLFLILVLSALSLLAVDGVVKTSTTTLVATAGTASCTFTSSIPQQPSGVHAVCTVGGVTILTMDTVVPTGPSNGIVGVFNPTTGNSISWMFTQPAGVVNYQVTANGQLSQGSF